MSTNNVYIELKVESFSISQQRPFLAITTGNRNLIFCRFAFDACWEGLEKTIIFSKKIEGFEYTKHLSIESDGTCQIPNEFMSEAGGIIVSVIAGDLRTVNSVTLLVIESGYKEETSIPPLQPAEIIVRSPEGSVQALRVNDDGEFEYRDKDGGWNVIQNEDLENYATKEELEEAVGALEDAIVEVAANVAENTSDIEILESAVGVNTGNISSLQATTATQGALITGLGARVEELEEDFEITAEAVAQHTADIADLGSITVKKAFAGTAGTVMSDLDVTSTSTAGTLVISKQNVSGNGTPITTNVALPIASETQAGLATPEIYAKLVELQTQMDGLSAADLYLVSLPSDTPTQAEILLAFQTASGKQTPGNGAQVFDSTRQLTFRFFASTGTWERVSVNIPTASQTQAGIMKGSEKDGQGYIEPDLTLSVVGWDAVKTAIANVLASIASLISDVAGKVSKVTGTANKVYVNMAGTDSAVEYGTGVAATRFPLRTSTGGINVPLLPDDNNSAVSKSYIVNAQLLNTVASFDDVTDPGNYEVALDLNQNKNAPYNNLPVYLRFNLRVFNIGSVLVQVAKGSGQLNNFVRSRSGTTWTYWAAEDRAPMSIPADTDFNNDNMKVPGRYYVAQTATGVTNSPMMGKAVNWVIETDAPTTGVSTRFQTAYDIVNPTTVWRRSVSSNSWDLINGVVRLPDGYDFNNIIGNGVFEVRALPNTNINQPRESAGNLYWYVEQFVNASDMRLQVARVNATGAELNMEVVFVRRKTTGTPGAWSNWIQDKSAQYVSNLNFNDITIDGVSMIAVSANTDVNQPVIHPSAATYWIVDQYTNAQRTIFYQSARPYTSTNNIPHTTLWQRSRNSGGTWSAWNQVGGASSITGMNWNDLRLEGNFSAYIAIGNDLGQPLTTVSADWVVKQYKVASVYIQEANTILNTGEAVLTRTWRRRGSSNGAVWQGWQELGSSGGVSQTIQSPWGQTVTTGTTGAITLNATSNYYQITPTANVTLTINHSAKPAGTTLMTFELAINMSTVRTVTLGSGISWLGGTAPDLSAIGYYMFTVCSVDGGANWVIKPQGKI